MTSEQSTTAPAADTGAAGRLEANVICTTHHHGCQCREQRFRMLYVRVNELLAELGAEGQVTTRNHAVDAVMEALYGIDKGTFDADKVFGR